MGFFSNIFRKQKISDTDLSRPDFDLAGVEIIKLGTNSFRIKDPKQTANIPLTSSVKKMDINNEINFSKEPEGNFVKLIYKRGWNFFGDENKPRGGVVADIVIMYDPETYKSNANYSNSRELKSVALEHCHVVWGRQNKASAIGDIGSGKIQYPTTADEIEIKNINSVDYAIAIKTSKKSPPTVCYFSALSERHIAIFSFAIDTYEGKDFYPVDFDSPETNLKEVAYWTIDQFMSRLELQRQT